MPGPKYYYDHRAGRMKPTGQGKLARGRGLVSVKSGRASGFGAVSRLFRSVFRLPRRSGRRR